MARNTTDWMLAEALESLARAERLHQHFFQLGSPRTGRSAAWEPPVDMLETEREVIVLVALPGVDPDKVEAVIQDGGVLAVSGRRVLPPELRDAAIHRLELPQGRFERRIPLPPGRYTVTRAAGNGCLVIHLAKSA